MAEGQGVFKNAPPQVWDIRGTSQAKLRVPGCFAFPTHAFSQQSANPSILSVQRIEVLLVTDRVTHKFENSFGNFQM